LKGIFVELMIISRAVSAALHNPNWGAPCHRGPKIPV